MNRITEAYRNLKAASDNLRSVIRQEFPIGTTLCATIGRSRFVATVEKYGCEWQIEDGDLYVRNTATGKLRRINVTWDGNEISHVRRPIRERGTK